MKTRLIRIGNSRGVRLPKAIIDQTALGDEVELSVKDGAIVIARVAEPREGWARAAAALAASGADQLLDAPVATRFDVDEWTW